MKDPHIDDSGPTATTPRLSEQFRQAACNYALLLQELEDGDFDMPDGQRRTEFWAVHLRLTELTERGRGLYTQAVTEWRRAEMEKADALAARRFVHDTRVAERKAAMEAHADILEEART